MKKELIVFKDPKSPISEVFRTLRTNIQFMNLKGKLRTLLVTSTLPGEGKSWTSSNLAVTFAQAGKKVIILDADMRKGRQYSIFGVSPRPGLSNYLSGVNLNEEDTLDLSDYIQETEVENLSVISSGNVPPNPSELLVSEKMLDLLRNLKNSFDIIIIDGPPTQLVTDSLILARIADSTVIVAESNKTKKENLRRIIDNIQNVGGKVAGVVLNKVQLSAKKYEQTYYYGSTSTKEKNNHTKISTTKNSQSSLFSNIGINSIDRLINSNKEKDKENLEKNEEITDNEGYIDNNQNAEYNVIEENTKNIENNDIEQSMETENNNFAENDNLQSNEETKMENNDYTQEQVNFNNNDPQGNRNDNYTTGQESFSNNYCENLGFNINQLDEKTQDIIRQVNEYMENERKNLNQ